MMRWYNCTVVNYTSNSQIYNCNNAYNIGHRFNIFKHFLPKTGLSNPLNVQSSSIHPSAELHPCLNPITQIESLLKITLLSPFH